MPLDLSNLRSVVVAARLGSLSRAAEALDITQPALSRRVAEVEATIDISLFERLPRGVRPTAAGHAFISHVQAALTSIDEGRTAAQEAENRRSRDIAFGVLENLCDDTLIAFDEPGVTFRYKDYRRDGPERQRVMTIGTDEFIRRFLLHVLPRGFHRVRHYGLLAGSARKANPISWPRLARVGQRPSAGSAPGWREPRRKSSARSTQQLVKSGQ